MIDVGTGPAVVVIPGLQGRWQWMQPTIRALTAELRVICFSLPGEPDSDRRFENAAGFDGFIAQVDAALDRAHIANGIICGVSFGGFIALRYAAVRPQRTRALVLVSAPGPSWTPSRGAQKCMDHPRLRFPQFCLSAGQRAWEELCHTFPNWRQRAVAALEYSRLVLAAPTTPTRMSQRAQSAVGAGFENDCARVTAPTLVITGEPGRDHVVPTETTLEYARLIKGARVATLERTGHLGIITKPECFARLVADFALSLDPERGSAAAGDGRPSATRTQVSAERVGISS